MSLTFRGGLPYGPEIEKLDEAFPVSSLTEGRIIEHERLESVLGVQRQTPRYYGVIRAWQTKQRNSRNIIIEFEQAVGLKVQAPAEVLDTAETRVRQKIKQTRRAVQRFGWVDRNRLDETGKKRLDHQVKNAALLNAALDKAKREIAIELAPVQSLPKRITG